MIPINQLKTDSNFFELTLSPVNLKPIIVRPLTADAIIEMAINKIPENYDFEPTLLDAFYREITQAKNLDTTLFKEPFKSLLEDTTIKEAVINIYREPYKDKKEKDDDLIRLLAWHLNISVHDTILSKAFSTLYGRSLNSVLQFDPLKDIKNSFLWHKNRKNYVFNYKGILRYDDLDVYVIDFDQAENIHSQSYKGTISIDENSLAFSVETTLPPSLSIADSKESRVRVEGS